MPRPGFRSPVIRRMLSAVRKSRGRALRTIPSACVFFAISRRDSSWAWSVIVSEPTRAVSALRLMRPSKRSSFQRTADITRLTGRLLARAWSLTGATSARRILTLIRPECFAFTLFSNFEFEVAVAGDGVFGAAANSLRSVCENAGVDSHWVDGAYPTRLEGLMSGHRVHARTGNHPCWNLPSRWMADTGWRSMESTLMLDNQSYDLREFCYIFCGGKEA